MYGTALMGGTNLVCCRKVGPVAYPQQFNGLLVPTDGDQMIKFSIEYKQKEGGFPNLSVWFDVKIHSFSSLFVFIRDAIPYYIP